MNSVIYDAKHDMLYVGFQMGNRWYLEWEDREVVIKAKTKPNIVFGSGTLFMIGDL